LPVRELFYRVQERVYEASEHRQFPYIYSGVVGEFFFRSGATKPAPKVDAAFEAWGLVKDSQNPADFDGFAQMFPSSDLARTAQIRAARLRRVATAVAVVSPRIPETSGLRAGATKVNPKDGLTYVWIPPGTFTMGCSPGDDECSEDEKPAHPVKYSLERCPRVCRLLSGSSASLFG
jgi:hypothetical protein